MKTNRNRTTLAMAVGGVLLLAAGTGAGYWLAHRGAADAPPAAPSASGEGGVLYWYDPMVPDQHFDKPGKSPFMDMQLVPKYADAGGATATVRIDPGVQQNLGLRTATVEVGRLGGELRVPGELGWDLRQEAVVSAPVRAVVSRLDVRAPYTQVRAGTPLATVLAPEWASAIAEARALGGAGSAYARGLQGAARQRLRVLGLSNTTAAAGGAVVLRSPRAGVVREILVAEGQAVMPGMALFRITGTSTLWLEASIPQGASGALQAGTPVTATVDAVPGRSFEGRVETLLPEVDPATRTRRARIVLRNEDELLAPGMFAQVTLQAGQGAAVPLVPSEAVIATGTDTRVIVAARDGGYAPVRVRTGRSSGGRTEILEGLAGGERVVTSGQFLIDSEASLSGALERLQAPSDTGTPAMPGAGAAPTPDGAPNTPTAPGERSKPAMRDMPGMPPTPEPRR